MLKGIIFDFDGVLFESVGVKAEGFVKVFADYPEHQEEILAYHLSTGGLSRFKKFEHIYRNILKEGLTEERSRELGRRLSENVFEAVVGSRYVDGAEDFLQKYHTQLSLFVASGTPEPEMIEIVKRKDIGHFLKGVYGSPNSKARNIRLILEQSGLPREEMIFVGDSLEDYHGAKEEKVSFFGRVHASYDNPYEGMDDVETVSDIFELERRLKDKGLIS